MDLKKHKTFANLPNNIRFYILTSSIVLSLGIAAWLRLQIPSDQLFLIRLEQVFGLLGVVYVYIAVITSPFSKAVGEQRPPIKLLLFARRGIGVSAAYFATLHFAIALWGQIGGLDSVGLLPGRFTFALVLGFLALLVLLAMAATSIDKVIKWMTLPRWKMLHRLVYGAGILIILHVWMIGTHVAYWWVTAIGFIALVIFFGLESLRIANNLAKKHSSLARRGKRLSVAVGIWIFWLAFILVLTNVVGQHHSDDNMKHPAAHQGAGHE